MRKRKISTEQMREVIRARMTKGAAFSMEHDEYKAHQEGVRQALADVSREDLFIKFSDYTYDMKY